jgi:hypothetical protein
MIISWILFTLKSDSNFKFTKTRFYSRFIWIILRIEITVFGGFVMYDIFHLLYN